MNEAKVTDDDEAVARAARELEDAHNAVVDAAVFVAESRVLRQIANEGKACPEVIALTEAIVAWRKAGQVLHDAQVEAGKRRSAAVMRPLYKTTIVIWSEAGGDAVELSTLAREAETGDAYCSRSQSVRVEDPAKDPDWDGTEFFGPEGESSDTPYARAERGFAEGREP